jgi:hypothetical protein
MEVRGLWLRYPIAKQLMPTFVNADPVAPGQERSIDECIAFGRQQWQTAWRIWARQWTQPALIKLAAETLKCRALHSSQVAGFANGSLRDPSPKLLLAVGELNLAIARSNGVKNLPEGPRCPGAVERFWKGKQWLCNPDGSPMGPADVFVACAGLIDLGMDTEHQIPKDREEVASRATGKYLRLALAKAGVDWMDLLPELRGHCPSMEPLLMGRTVPADQLVADLPALAAAIDADAEELWGLAIAPTLS